MDEILRTTWVTNMDYMFYSFKSANLSFTLGSNFDTSNLLSTEHMFHSFIANSLTFGSEFNTENVTSMKGMFIGTLVTTINLGSGFQFNRNGNNDAFYTMFKNAINLTSLNLGNNFHTDCGHGFKEMFSGCTNLSSLYLGPHFCFFYSPLDEVLLNNQDMFKDVRKRFRRMYGICPNYNLL